ncbi:MAG: aspartate aminotransferase family protein [Deltaproteobacteria bacterium]|nr:aspartate aminotransferase family protein [Deltaproteobacteria bacterium]
MDLQALLATHAGEQHDLFAATVNPQLVRVLKTIGFDKEYTRAQGQYLFDACGHRYLDFLSGYGVFNMGRNHPRIKAAIAQALELDLPNMVQMDAPLPAGLLAKRLLAILPPAIDRVFFTNSGTEANEAAIKFSRCATRRSRICYFTHAFHGLTNGSLSVNGNAEFRDGFEPLLPGCVGIPLGDLDALERELRQKDVAALIVEPIQGKGVYLPPDGFFAAAQEICRRYGTLLVLDEVQTGLGRTGRWFGFEHWGLTPDIVTIAKALSGGLIPVGACCYSATVYERVYSSMERCVVHSNTFGRNTLAMVAGLAALDVLEEEGLAANAAARGMELLDGLRAMQQQYELIEEVRGIGCMIGIEFGRPRSLKLRAGWELIHTVNRALFGQLIVVPLMTDHRILTQVAGHNVIVKLLPPLVITPEDVRYFLSAFETVVAACHEFPGAAWDVGKGLAKRAMTA